MKRSFGFIFGALVAACIIRAHVDESYARPRCNRRNCQGATQPALAHPTPKPAPPANVGGISLPNLQGCDARGHGQAISSYLYKIGNAMELIRVGVKPANSLFGSCKIFPSGLRNSCCTKFKSEAVKQCKAGVLAQAAQDHECALRATDCRLIRPVQCAIQKITERKRAECCNWLKPHGKRQLLEFCDAMVDQMSNGCEAAPGSTNPRFDQPTATDPLEPVGTVVPEDPALTIPNESAE
mgnify:CR=1 FL=1